MIYLIVSGLVTRSLTRGFKSFQRTADAPLLASYMSNERVISEREGKGRGMEKKMAFVGFEPTPSAIRADVLSQLD